MSLHTWRHQGPRKPSKKVVCSRVQGLLCAPVDCGLPGSSGRGGALQAGVLERVGQHWLPYPSRALYFLLPQLPTHPSTWCCQNPCDPSSCTTSARPSQGQTQALRAASGANPSGRPTGRGGDETTTETRGGGAKEGDPHPARQLCTVQSKSTRSAKQTVSVEDVKGH